MHTLTHSSVYSLAGHCRSAARDVDANREPRGCARRVLVWHAGVRTVVVLGLSISRRRRKNREFSLGQRLASGTPPLINSITTTTRKRAHTHTHTPPRLLTLLLSPPTTRPACCRHALTNSHTNATHQVSATHAARPRGRAVRRRSRGHQPPTRHEH
jgi:hypothetical protein